MLSENALCSYESLSQVTLIQRVFGQGLYRLLIFMFGEMLKAWQRFKVKHALARDILFG